MINIRKIKGIIAVDPVDVDMIIRENSYNSVSTNLITYVKWTNFSKDTNYQN